MGLIQKIINSKPVERAKRKLAINTGIFIKFKKLTPSASDDLRTVKILNTYGFDTVLDIGANTGQFAESLIDFGYEGKIISFEPTSDAYAVLEKRAKEYSNWAIAEKCAIGNFDGTIDINVSKNSVFSSIKKINTEYSTYNQESQSVETETVNIYTLDSLESKYFTNKNILLKIDTQGFEKEVLEGAKKVLSKINGVKLEIPLNPIYDNVEWGIKDIMDFFYENGFKCVSLNPVAVNNKTGIVHEADGIFIRKNLIQKT